MAQPHAKMAMREDAVKSEKPISCSHMVKNTIAFQGVDPLPANRKTSNGMLANQTP